nr:MAG TPA: hypothetical protein [Caudoviricetes sp.]
MSVVYIFAPALCPRSSAPPSPRPERSTREPSAQPSAAAERARTYRPP